MLDHQTIEDAVNRMVRVAYSPMKVILFGSYAKGNAREDSDLDLMVVEKNIPSMAEEYSRLRGALGAIGTGVDLLLYKQEDFERRSQWQTSPAYDAARHGLVLYERHA
jgi:uncharacterized protein